MHMPKTPVDKYDCFIFWENNIGVTCIPLIIFSISETMCKQVFSYKLFRLGIITFNSRHIKMTLFLGMIIH